MTKLYKLTAANISDLNTKGIRTLFIEKAKAAKEYCLENGHSYTYFKDGKWHDVQMII